MLGWKGPTSENPEVFKFSLILCLLVSVSPLTLHISAGLIMRTSYGVSAVPWAFSKNLWGTSPGRKSLLVSPLNPAEDTIFSAPFFHLAGTVQ